LGFKSSVPPARAGGTLLAISAAAYASDLEGRKAIDEMIAALAAAG